MKTFETIVMLAALGAAAPAWAQVTGDAPASADSLTTIVVTAEKREEKLADVPLSVTVLPGDSLDKLMDRDFSDYAALVPGLSIYSAQPGLTRLTLRGQNAGGDGSTVAVYLDESPLGSSNALVNGATNTADFDTWDLTRIEVLRGPQGTLYGANSEGGLIKFVTTAPVLGSFSGAAEVSGDSVAQGGQGDSVHATLNLPLGGAAALRVSGFDEDDPGYIRDLSRGATQLNDGHKYGGRASLLLEPVDALSIRLTASSQRSAYNGTNVVDVDPLTLAPVHGDLSQERFVNEPSRFKYDNYNATINWDLGPVRVVSSTSYGLTTTDTVSDYTSIVLVPPSTTLGELLSAVVGPNLGGRLDDDVETKKFTQELRLSSATSGPFEWTVGGYFTREIGSITEHLDAVTLPSQVNAGLPSLEIPIIDSVFKESAGFLNLTYHWGALDLQAGGRYSKNEQTAAEDITGLLVAPQTFNAESSEHVFTYSFAPEWHFNANTSLYARLATGYRPGGPNELPPLAPPSVPREYGSDRTTNVELGIRSALVPGMLSLDVAAYHVHWKDIQLLEEVDSYGVNGNGGTARSQGLEWTVDYNPWKELTLRWSGALTDAILTAPAPAVNGVSGDPLPWVPKWSTAIDGEYDRQLYAGLKGFLGSTLSFIDNRRSDFASSSGTIPGQVELPSYYTIDARLGVDYDRYRVMLYGKNLTDSRGITNYVANVAPGLAGEVTVIQPRTVGLTVAAKF